MPDDVESEGTGVERHVDELLPGVVHGGRGDAPRRDTLHLFIGGIWYGGKCFVFKGVQVGDSAGSTMPSLFSRVSVCICVPAPVSANDIGGREWKVR